MIFMFLKEVSHAHQGLHLIDKYTRPNIVSFANLH